MTDYKLEEKAEKRRRDEESIFDALKTSFGNNPLMGFEGFGQRGHGRMQTQSETEMRAHKKVRRKMRAASRKANRRK